MLLGRDSDMRVAKYIAIVFLVVVLAGVAYIRALYSHQTHPDTQSGMMSQTEVNVLVDSLRRFYVDSLASANAYSAVVSSDPVNIDSLKTEIARLNTELADASGEIKKLTADNARKMEKLIHSFYDHEVAALPADLSSYERSVSIKEIKGKAMKYFGVSSDHLNRILSRKK